MSVIAGVMACVQVPVAELVLAVPEGTELCVVDISLGLVFER